MGVKIEVGVIARLKGAGYRMTVVDASDPTHVKCCWHTSSGEPKRERYPIEALVFGDEAKRPPI